MTKNIKRLAALCLSLVMVLLPVMAESVTVQAEEIDYDAVVLENNQSKYASARTDEVAKKYYTEARGSAAYIMDPDLEEVHQKAKDIIREAGAEGMSDYDKAKVLHDWVCSNIAYDFYHYSCGGYIEPRPSKILNSKKAVCGGYALMYLEFCRGVGIPCKYVSGYGINLLKGETWRESNYDYATSDVNGAHAWNEVLVEKDGVEKWIIVDTTWDSNLKVYDEAGTVSGSDIPNTKYFDISVEEFAKDHRVDASGEDNFILSGELNVTAAKGSSDTEMVVTISHTEPRNWKRYKVVVSSGTGAENITYPYAVAIQGTDKVVNKKVKFTVTPGTEYTIAVTGYNSYDQERIDSGWAYNIEAAPIQYTAEKTEIAEYTISYNLDGGTNSESNPAIYTQDTETITLGEPVKTGYAFSGWYLDEAYTKNVTEIAKGTTGDITLYAKWTANTYIIVFYGNGGSGGTMNSMTCEYGKTYTLPANVFSKKGYTFKEWKSYFNGANGPSYADKAEITNLTSENGVKINFYAQWKKSSATPTLTPTRTPTPTPTENARKSYTITYVLNGGKNNSANPAKYTAGSSAALKAPTKKGYLFSGWYEDGGYKSKITAIPTTAKKNYTLYAKWKKVVSKKSAVSSAKNSKSKSIALKFKKVTGVKGYEVSYSTDKKLKKSVVKKRTAKTGYTIKKLKKGKTYYVRVRTYKLDSTGAKVYSAYSKVKKVKIKK